LAFDPRHTARYVPPVMSFLETFIRFAYDPSDAPNAAELSRWVHSLASAELRTRYGAVRIPRDVREDAAQEVLLTLAKCGKALAILDTLAADHPRLERCLEGELEADSLMQDAGRLLKGYVAAMLANEYRATCPRPPVRRAPESEESGPGRGLADQLLEDFAEVLARIQRGLREQVNSVPVEQSFREIVELSLELTSIPRLCVMYGCTRDTIDQRHHRLRKRILQEIDVMERDGLLSAHDARQLRVMMQALVRCRRQPPRRPIPGGQS